MKDAAGRLYCDHHATAPMLAEVHEILSAQWRACGNASSVHEFGRERRRIVDAARASLATFFAVPNRHVIFTASATEANNLALRGVAAAHLLVSAVEHESVWQVAQALQNQCEVATIGVTAQGGLDEDSFHNTLMRVQGQPFLVSLMAANNETGVIWDIPHYAARIHEAGGWLHCDAVQAFGRLPPHHYEGADMVSLSAHKIGGGMGAGALIVTSRDENLLSELQPLIHGGGQEFGLRGGTENVPAIAAFAEAARHCPAFWKKQEHLAQVRDAFEEALAKDFKQRVTFWGTDEARLASVSCASIAGWRSEEIVMALDLEGIAVSSGSACSSGQIHPSRVLTAMGANKNEAAQSVRVSFGLEHSIENAHHLAQVMKRLAPPLN